MERNIIHFKSKTVLENDRKKSESKTTRITLNEGKNVTFTIYISQSYFVVQDAPRVLDIDTVSLLFCLLTSSKINIVNYQTYMYAEGHLIVSTI